MINRINIGGAITGAITGGMTGGPTGAVVGATAGGASGGGGGGGGGGGDSSSVGSGSSIDPGRTGGSAEGSSSPEVAVAPDYVTPPTPTFISYDPITAAPYNMVNIQKFARRWGNINRAQITKNAQLSQDLALKQLDTELKGMQNYVPAAAALERQTVSADNVFNQAERIAQVNKALPGVQAQLEAQRARAESYASGRLPSDIEDRALELSARSQAADIATAAGFGSQSSVSRKASDLLSAQQRMQLSQYGDQLLTQNINQKSQLFLAPTEYSNAGQQVRVMPTLSGSQLSQANLAQVNANTMIPATSALATRVDQNQFKTNLIQQTNQFNATNTLATDQFNANAANEFKMAAFQYNVGYQGTLAGVATANNSLAFQLQQQQMFNDMMEHWAHEFQKQQQTQTWANFGAWILTMAAEAYGGSFGGAGAGAGAGGGMGSVMGY